MCDLGSLSVSVFQSTDEKKGTIIIRQIVDFCILGIHERVLRSFRNSRFCLKDFHSEIHPSTVFAMMCVKC